MLFDDKNDTKQQKKLRDIQTWTDLFKYTIEITKQQTHCATLAYYKKTVQDFDDTKGYGIASFMPFPLYTDQEQFVMNAYYFKSDSFPTVEESAESTEIDTSSIYCIIFMDYNFISSLNTKRVIKTRDEETHSLTFAVVIPTL